MMADSSNDITALLRRANEGDLTAESSLYDLVYSQLRRRATSLLRGDRLASVVSSGTLVHESFQKLFRSSDIEWKNRAHFYLVAARAMRQVVIEHSRSRMALIRGGHLAQVSLDLAEGESRDETNIELVVAVSEMCDRLSIKAPRAAEVVELRFFGGLTIAETADILNVSETIVDERQRYAKAFMRREWSRTPRILDVDGE